MTTVRAASRWTRRINASALTLALALALGAIVNGVRALTGPRLSVDGVPVRTIVVVSFVVAAVLLLAAIGDLRVLRFGALRGRPRLARHLWRMCFALFIAAGSFFSVRERVATILPQPLTGRDARAADPASVWRDVLLVVESPPPKAMPDTARIV